MEELNQIAETLSVTMGAAWASGINLYAAILVFGLLGVTGNVVLPEGLHILMNPLVIGAAGLMYLAEFVADKVPVVDSGWDSVHTFIRIPAGALMAAGAVGDISPALAIAAGLCGGGMAATSHAVKAGSRVVINTSPEPVTNWTASVAEDVAVVGGLWAALNHPWVFLLLLLVFLLLAIWLLPKIWRGIRKVFGFLARLLGVGKGDASVHSASAEMANESDIEARIRKLKDLLDKGLITPEEFKDRKASLLEMV